MKNEHALLGQLREILHTHPKDSVSWPELIHYLNLLQQASPQYVEHTMLPYLEDILTKQRGQRFSTHTQLLYRLKFLVELHQLHLFHHHVIEQLSNLPDTYLGPPSDPKHITEIEKELGHVIPLPLRHLYTLANGASICEGFWEWKSLDELVSYTQEWRGEHPDYHQAIPVLDWIDQFDVVYVKGHCTHHQPQLFTLNVFGECNGDDSYGTWEQLWGNDLHPQGSSWLMPPPLAYMS